MIPLLDEKEIIEILNDVHALKRKDKAMFEKILYLMKGIRMGQELESGVAPK